MPIDFEAAATRLRACAENLSGDPSEQVSVSANDLYVVMAEQSVLKAANKMQTEKISGLSEDLRSAVRVAFKAGRTEWVRLNYPDMYGDLLEGQ